MTSTDPATASPVAFSSAPVKTVRTDLRKGSVGLTGVLMQSIAQISPTLGVFYTIAFTTTQAGISAPLTYLAAFAVCLVLAVPMLGLARHLPSAGGFYTYVSQGIGPRSGFMTGWLYAIMVTIVPAALAAFTGAVLQDELTAKYGFGLPWWVYALVIFAVCFACAYRGIVISVRFLVVMSVFEILVGLALALTGVLNPGPGGLNVAGFNPANISGSSGFFLAIVLSIFAFTGFESAAAVADESRDPRRIVPQAIFGSLALVGAFYLICAWGLQIGWGTDNLEALATSPTAPAFVLADRLWSGGSIIVLVALVNSGLGVCIACTTSSTRTLFGMARTGALPSPPRSGQPHARHTGRRRLRAGGPRGRHLPGSGHPDGPLQPVQPARDDGHLRLHPDLHPDERGRLHVLPHQAPRRVQRHAVRDLPDHLDRSPDRHRLQEHRPAAGYAGCPGSADRRRLHPHRCGHPVRPQPAARQPGVYGQRRRDPRRRLTRHNGATSVTYVIVEASTW